MTLKAAAPLALALACCRTPSAAPPRSVEAASTAAGVCRRTGCGGEVCAAEDVATTCQWLPEHACWRAARCERQPDGRCGFTPDDALARCLEEARAQRPAPLE